MSTTIPQQHPAVVLRTKYDSLRTLMVVAVVAVVALVAALTWVLVTDDDPATPLRSAAPAAAVTPAVSVGPHGAPGALEREHAIVLHRSGLRIPSGPAPRYDGGPEEGTRGPLH